MFRVPPALGEFGLVIVDEAFWPAASAAQSRIQKSRLIISSLADELAGALIRGHHDKPDITADDAAARPDRAATGRAGNDGRWLRDARAADRWPACDPATADEPGSRKAASDLEWRRKVDHKLKPNSSDQFREKVVAKFGFMRRIPKRSYMWRALAELIESGDEASGRLKIEMVKTEDGEQRALRRCSSASPSPEKLYDLPIIHADATLQLELAQHISAQARPCSRSQCSGHRICGWFRSSACRVGKSSLEPKPPGVRRGQATCGAWTETPEEAEARVAHKREASPTPAGS